MTGSTTDYDQPGAPVRKTRRAQYAILGGVCALVIGIYAWNARSGCLELSSSNAENTYYNLLVQGFRAGQLNLKKEVPSGLVLPADFYDPEANSWLLELSHYQGKFYLYFGITPALVLFWPYVAVTGHYLLHKDAVVIFFSVGFLASVGLLWALWRRYFAEVGFGIVVAGALALGLANFTPAVLPRSDIHEVAISCGCVLTMLALAAIWNALHDSRRRSWWLTAASLAYGLALGARPSLLFGAVILLVPVAMMWRERAATGQRPQLWTLLLAATGPITVMGVGLLLYNYLRFDDPLEFGQRYQLPAGPNQQFSLHYLWFNFRICFLEPARWDSRFPFVRDITVPPLPRGSGGVFEAFGVLTNIPFVWLALAVPLAWRGRETDRRAILRWFLWAVALVFVTSALVLCLHDSMVLRYEAEFACVLVWLAVVGIFGLERALASRPGWRRVVRWGWGLLLAFSVAFNLLAMVGISSNFYAYRSILSFRKGQMDEAITLFERALELQPYNAEAHSGLGMTLFEQGRVPEAIAHLEQALRIKPDFAEAHNNMGTALLQQGKAAEAIGHLEQALRLKPIYAETRNNLGAALAQQGKLAEAVVQYEQALKIKPGYAEAHNNLGNTLVWLGKVPEAIGHYEEVLRLKPDGANARNNLAWVLATCADGAVRNGARAVELAEGANQRTGGKDAAVLDTLAVSYAEAGRFDEAARTAQAALELAKAAGQTEQARQIQERLQLYQAGRPYHEGSAPAP